MICSRCNVANNDREVVQETIGQQEFQLCKACLTDLQAAVENYHWPDRYTEEQHERALEILRSRDDEIHCAHGAYELGQIAVHTPYVSSDVVTDVCDHFGLEIMEFGPLWADESSELECIKNGEHGDCFEILLEYTQQSPAPIPLQGKFIPIDIDSLDSNDKQF